MQTIAEGYGFAAETAHEKNQIEKILRRLNLKPDTVFMAHWIYYPDDDPITGYHSGSEKIKEITALGILQEIIQEFRGYNLSIQDVNDFKETFMEITESDYGRCRAILTPEESKKLLLDERRKRLEANASLFAKTHNCSTNSFEFIQAIKKAIRNIRSRQDEWNNPEVRMEEWAACRHNGLGAETYFDDLNFENGRYSQQINYLHDILDWLREACPLLMAQYDEQMLQEEDSEDEEDGEDG